jgi:hypothetical protein
VGTPQQTFTREPRGGPHRASAGRPEAARSPDSLRAAAPCQGRCSVHAKWPPRMALSVWVRITQEPASEQAEARPSAAGAEGRSPLVGGSLARCLQRGRAPARAAAPTLSAPRPPRWRSPPSPTPGGRTCKSLRAGLPHRASCADITIRSYVFAALRPCLSGNPLDVR